jgi:hypothetical protein
MPRLSRLNTTCKTITLRWAVTIELMSFSERFNNKTNKQENLRQRFAQLRQQVHQSMKVEEEVRLNENPIPTEEELYMGAFKEWLEPQVRSAISEMYRKGYATQSSGFHGTECDIQMIDGYFKIDPETKVTLQQIGVEVLRGADIGLPKNKLITILRFRVKEPSITKMKEKWDAVATLLPEKKLPRWLRPISDRAEEFRLEYAPEHPSLEETREKQFEYLAKNSE